MSERDNAIARIMRAQLRLYQHFAFDRSDPLIAANLTMPQLKALLVLSLRPDASGQDVMEVMGISLATVTGIVDRRVRRLELTAAGRELIDGINTAGAAHQKRLLSRLDVDKLLVVEQALGYILEAADAESDHP